VPNRRILRRHRLILQLPDRRGNEGSLWCVGDKPDGVSPSAGPRQVCRADPDHRRVGVELIGTNDTSFIGGDAYVRATLIAQTARNAQVGIHPTNPLTREPQIMAAFLASIDAMTEGRAFLDIGSGDSAVYNIGLAPASRARLADYVACVRDLIATGEGSYDCTRRWNSRPRGGGIGPLRVAA
jgi:alkanesulfonate monooxygenase SsuD/methylene tetrahydromethanopterin reductase-like flavin-dependent oxidoreductase (luciferase family)